MTHRRITLFCLGLLHLVAAIATAQTSNEWKFIDNGTIRLGVKLTSGAGIAWLSQSNSDKNFINHWDHGRLIQQSYYGNEDNSLWNKTPWRWNPVQGGDWKGSPAKVLEIRSTTNSIYSNSAKTLGEWRGSDEHGHGTVDQSDRRGRPRSL